jgi:PQQ-dependent dehydrogenase (methanol/ethanol family)
MRRLLWIVAVFAAAAVIYYRLSPQPEPAPASAEVSEQRVPPAMHAMGVIDDERIINADDEPGNWLSHGRTFEEQRFSPLTQINRENVAELGLAWFRDMGTNRTLEATPIVVDGTMYVTSAWSRVHAIDAHSGEAVWSYDPEVAGEWGRKACCGVVNRGVAVYQGKVYVGALDGRLIALDAAAGEQVWVADTFVDREQTYTITGAPLAAAGKIFIGNGGAEYGVRGYVSAYDAETGELAWRFFTVPGDPSQPFEHPEMEMAAKTWSGSQWWEYGGGGTVWNSIVYDPDFNQVYLGVGNGAPWTREIRSPGGGDNLFLASIVAVDADTGRMNWYYQTVPAENWDYTATQDMALADMEVDGEMRKVLLQAPKNGFFYVIDRADGELLRAHPFATVNWATHIDMETGRPVENPDVAYLEKENWVLPGPLGAHNWQAMSVDVEAGLVYLPTHDTSILYAMAEEWKETGKYQLVQGRWNMGIEMQKLMAQSLENIDGVIPSKGYLKAFDPLTGENRWVVEQPHYWNGGVLGTAGGLVFQGDAMGFFNAHDKENGEVLWQFNAWTSILAPPITWQLGSVQYVSILTGTGGGDLFSDGQFDEDAVSASVRYGNSGRLLVFALGENEELPPATTVDRMVPEQNLADVPVAEIAQGERIYNDYCIFCHGIIVRSGGVIPDLRLMKPAVRDIFKQIVFDGVYESNGMASFSDVLTESEVEQVHHFIRARAHEDREVSLGNQESARLTWLDE